MWDQWLLESPGTPSFQRDARATLQLIARAAAQGSKHLKYFSTVWTVCFELRGADGNMEIRKKGKGNKRKGEGKARET